MFLRHAFGVFIFFLASVWAMNAFFLYQLLEGDARAWEGNLVFGCLPLFEDLWRIPMNYIAGLSAQIATTSGFSHGTILAGVNIAIVTALLGISAMVLFSGKPRSD